MISTLAGDGIAGYSGDGGPASASRLYYPRGLVMDNLGNLLIADEYNHAVRKVTAAGVITTLARVGYPYALAIDAGSNLFVASHMNMTVTKIPPVGSPTILLTSFGSFISGITVDTGGSVFFSARGPRVQTPADGLADDRRGLRDRLPLWSRGGAGNENQPAGPGRARL